MKEKISLLKEEINNKINDIKDEQSLYQLKLDYLGKKGKISELIAGLSSLSIDEKKEYGLLLNTFKDEVNLLFDNKSKEINDFIINQKLKNEKIDVTLPSTKINVGCPNILEKFTEEMEELLISMGYDVVEGPEVEQDLYNFELLNLPVGHPARDAQDTFYTKDETILLRSHTSPVQIRTMLANKEKTAIKIICPGKAYRRDADDATHSHQFAQIEGLYIDKNVSLANLKATLDIIAKTFFNSETRFRPSYYPFTEPSVEFDIKCFKCHGEGCNICKDTGWITVGGAGVVHYNVLKDCGYDPEAWSGFAFGFGLERLAMLKYGIDDIRTFYTNDLRYNDLYNRRDK